MSKHVIAILIISSIFGVISFDTFVMKAEPTLFHMTFSVLFLVLWGLYGIYMGKKKSDKFIPFITGYWVVAAFLLIFGIFAIPFVYYPAAILFTIPIYGGIGYYFDIIPSLLLDMLTILTLYVICLCGYFFGSVYLKFKKAY